MTNECKTAFLLIFLAATGIGYAQTGAERTLSRRQAIEMALAAETGATPFRESLEEVERERARRRQALASLLPQLSASLRQSSQTSNLEALGLRPQGLFRPPGLVGPFSTFDARLNLDITLFSLASVRNLRASDRAIDRELEENGYARDRIASQVSQYYVAALRRQAELEVAEARLELAGDLLALAQHQREAGIGTAIEQTRAELEVSAARQHRMDRQLEARNGQRQLAHFLALDLDQELRLTDPLDDVSSLQWSYPAALQRALDERKDLRALENAILEAEQRLAATRSTRLPELHGFAQYGTIGSAVSNTIPTWAVGAEVQIPIYRGGRTEARISEAASLLRSRRLAAADLRRQIDLEVRSGLDRLQLTARQITLGLETRTLAADEVSRAERRYRAGIASNLEVVQAQTHLKEADDGLVGARYAHQLARISLGEALGIILTELP